jgi:insulysin
MGDVDQRADGQASRLWGECALRRYDFDRPWRNARRMRAVTREGLIAFFDDHIAATAPARRRLSTHVFAKRAAPKALRVDPLPDEYWPPLQDRLAKKSAVDRVAVV